MRSVQATKTSAFAGVLSPLPDSNRGPPPYHGGCGQQLWDAENAFGSALSLQFAWFSGLLPHLLEGP
jgi:hypothetical protein